MEVFMKNDKEQKKMLSELELEDDIDESHLSNVRWRRSATTPKSYLRHMEKPMEHEPDCS